MFLLLVSHRSTVQISHPKNRYTNRYYLVASYKSHYKHKTVSLCLAFKVNVFIYEENVKEVVSEILYCESMKIEMQYKLHYSVL